MRGQAPTIRHERKRTSHKTTCPTTGKRSFNTRKKALKAPAPIGQSWSVYVCPHCGDWHGSTQARMK